MDAQANKSTATVLKAITASKNLTGAPVAAREVGTRDQLPAKLSSKPAILRSTDTTFPEPGIATRHYPQARGAKRKKILKTAAVVVGLLPPVWPVSFVGWMVWRTRPPQKSMRLVKKAIKSIEKGQHGVALKQLQEAHYLDPSNNDALYWLGFLLKRLKRNDEAAEALSLVSERVPGMPEVEAALVSTYITMDEPEGALYHAQRLLDVAPYEPDTLIKLADAHEASGNVDLAIQALSRVPLHKPTLTDKLVDIHYRLGLLHESKGNAEQANLHFERVYARDISYKDIRSRMQQIKPAAPDAASDADKANNKDEA